MPPNPIFALILHEWFGQSTGIVWSVLFHLGAQCKCWLSETAIKSNGKVYITSPKISTLLSYLGFFFWIGKQFKFTWITSSLHKYTRGHSIGNVLFIFLSSINAMDFFLLVRSSAHFCSVDQNGIDINHTLLGQIQLQTSAKWWNWYWWIMHKSESNVIELIWTEVFMKYITFTR